MSDNPWPSMVIFCLLAVVLLAFWQRRRQAIFLVAAVGMVGLSIGAYVLDQLLVTEEEVVEAHVRDFVHAFAEKNLEKTLGFISVSVQVESLRNSVTTANRLIDEITDVRITDLTVKLAAENSRARTHFRVNATFTLANEGYRGRRPTRWELLWQREAGSWKVIEVQRLDPLSGKELGLLSPR